MPKDISADRFEKRATLLNTLDGSGPKTLSTDGQSAVRARYGDHPFGRMMLHDRLQRPWPITNGRVIKALI